MGIYDIILKRIKEIQSKTKEDEPVTNISTSSMLAAEITLISSLIVASIMLRFINKALMMVAVLILILIAVIAMPIMPKLRKEQSDSFS
ncbi:MAG: energy-converting hydrogenase B subunit G, EhbG, partial [Euryarchaeota archaeon]|nr:energy-converting hydrogenase B subunit G, EhbG [Euryarchaeota archaeon]